MGPIRLLRGYSLYHEKDWNELANNHPVIKKFEEEKIPINIFDLYEQDHIIQPASQQKQALKEAIDNVLLSVEANA